MRRLNFDELVSQAKSQSHQISGPVYAELAKAEAVLQQAFAVSKLADALDKLADAHRRNRLP